MTIQKTAVFISSRFAEFATLRKLLARKINEVGKMRLHAIELDDNGADDRAPSELCIGLIKHAEVVVLLLGDSYGPLAEGHQLSHTHLEYRAAQDMDSDARVLPYFIQSAAGSAGEERLEAFRQEVLRNHRVAHHPRPENDVDWEALAGVVFNNIVSTLLELSFQEPGQEHDEDGEMAGPVAAIPDAELARLQNLRQQPMSELASMLAPPRIESVQDALSQPRALEAYEQMREARLALEIGERRIAERHLRSAAELRPLDPAAAEWLARVLVSSGRKKSALEAITLADRAARIYARMEQTLRAAGALVLAARASTGHDRARGVAYAKAAVEQAGWYAQTHFELARQLSMDGQSGAALASLERAFYCHPPIIEGVYNDPAFEDNRDAVDQFIQQMHQRVGTVITGVQAAETAMARRLGLAERAARDLSADARLWRRVYACRDAVRRQMRELQNLAASYLSAVAMNASDDAPQAVYQLEASALSLHTQDGLEISFLAAAGANVKKGQEVFRHSGANARASRIWYAPVAMKLMWTTRATSLRGSDTVLTWSPTPEYVTAAEHRTRQSEQRRTLAQAQHQQANLAARKKQVGRKLIAGITAVCAGVAGAYLMRANSAAGVLLTIATAYSAYVCNRLQRQNAALRGSIAQCLQRISVSEGNISEEQRNLDALQRIQNERLTLLQEMVSLFERQALSLVSVSMPFQGLRSARVGDWVVVAMSSVREYAASFGATLHFKDWPHLPLQTGGLSLLRVVQRDGGQITLERAGAYLPGCQPPPA